MSDDDKFHPDNFSLDHVTEEMCAPTDENPEITEEFLKNARPGAEVFAELGMEAPRGVGRPALGDKAKKATSIRLDADVLDGLRATGRGWQSRVNALLKRALVAGDLNPDKGDMDKA